MKIIFFSNSMWSIYNFRRNLILYLIGKGFEIYILSNEDEYIKHLQNLGCNILRIKFKRRKFNILSEIILFIRLIIIFRRINPKYILNFTIKPIIIGGLASSLLKIKYISTITGMGKMFTNKKNDSFIGII